MYVVRGLGGVLYLTGALIMVYNLWQTVRALPRTEQAGTTAVPAE
jgi:cytochrome c oxidase cbb3-type subunit 1